MRPEDLTAPERELWEAFPAGRLLDFRSGDPAADDPARGEGWGPERTVRAQVVAALLLGAREAEPGAQPAVELRGARIAGRLTLDHAEIGHHLRITDSWFEQQPSLYGTRMRQLSLNGSRLPGLLASQAVIDGIVRMRHCTVDGDIRLVGATVTGALLMDGCRIAGPDGQALTADRLRVENDAFLRDGFTAEGRVTFRNAVFGSNLHLGDARLSNPGGVALDAVRAQIEGDLSASRLEAEGMVRMPGARIAGTFFLGGARLHHPGGRALYASALEVGAGLLLRDGCTVTGEVRLASARIEGGLDLRGARLSAGEGGGTALTLLHAQVRDLDLLTDGPPQGRVSLRHATIGVLRDDPASWPARLNLDGTVYGRFGTLLPAARRLRWLALDDEGYLPQPYEQLAAVYRAVGHDDEARRVLLAKQRARRAGLPWYARLWGHLQDLTVGYGYQPARALLWLLGLLAAGTAMFTWRGPVGPEPVECDPAELTFDLLVPVGSIPDCQSYGPPDELQWFGYLLMAAGWLLATTVAAAITRGANRP
ncbi:hypothetical protein AB0M28_01550 [Streptomyces sp. NPDC051940]|uniref:hypothetical protein n=1 Tax=Streptomyces sp. NPDC051940 TaxID=3155675 RepID=UPI0034365570